MYGICLVHQNIEIFDMGTTKNYLGARDHVEQTRLQDSVHAARWSAALEVLARSQSRGLTRRQPVHRLPPDLTAHLLPPAWPQLPVIDLPDQQFLKDLQRKFGPDSSDHPLNWHKRLVAAELAKPRIAEAYFKIRRALWGWQEFAGVRPGARAILEAVIELARDEAFPWYLAIPAENVRRIVRLSEHRYSTSVRELESLAVTRPARIARVCDVESGLARWPPQIDGPQPDGNVRFSVENRPLNEPVAQWVVRYRRGIPWNKKRAAWWINYDLLCDTSAVLPIFVCSLATLSKHYWNRNRRRLGPARPGWPVATDAEAFAEMERGLVKCGPVPPVGMRAALWEPVTQ